MKNFRNSGQEVTFNNPSTAKKSGDVVVIGSMCGILANDAAVGQDVSADIEGVFALKKAAGLAIAQGDKVYWNLTTGVTKTNTDAKLGLATKAALSADLSVEVKLVPGMVP